MQSQTFMVYNSRSGLLLLLISAVFALPLFSQIPVDTTVKAPYFLPSPAGWAHEVFPLPPEFAKDITVHGTEDIRFTPGWGDTTSQDHWAYTFLWWLDKFDKPEVSMLKKNLNLYYTGLVTRNIAGLDPSVVTKTTVEIRIVKTLPGDTETWNGAITMFDYHTKKKMILNAIIHAKPGSTTHRLAIIFELSPQPFDNPVWERMHVVNNGFRVQN